MLTIKECSTLTKSGDFPEPNTFCLPNWEREKVRLLEVNDCEGGIWILTVWL